MFSKKSAKENKAKLVKGRGPQTDVPSNTANRPAIALPGLPGPPGPPLYSQIPLFPPGPSQARPTEKYESDTEEEVYQGRRIVLLTVEDAMGWTKSNERFRKDEGLTAE